MQSFFKSATRMLAPLNRASKVSSKQFSQWKAVSAGSSVQMNNMIRFNFTSNGNNKNNNEDQLDEDIAKLRDLMNGVKSKNDAHHHHHDGCCGHDHSHQHNEVKHNHDHNHESCGHDHSHSHASHQHQHDHECCGHDHSHDHHVGHQHNHEAGTCGHDHSHDHHHHHHHDHEGGCCGHDHSHDHSHEHGITESDLLKLSQEKIQEKSFSMKSGEQVKATYSENTVSYSIDDTIKGVKARDPEHGQLVLMFTCTVCNTRSTRSFTKKAYTQGVVLLRCETCDSLHLIADNLGWFNDEKSNIETIMEAKGEKVHTIKDQSEINDLLSFFVNKEDSSAQESKTTEEPPKNE